MQFEISSVPETYTITLNREEAASLRRIVESWSKRALEAGYEPQPDTLAWLQQFTDNLPVMP